MESVEYVNSLGKGQRLYLDEQGQPLIRRIDQWLSETAFFAVLFKEQWIPVEVSHYGDDVLHIDIAPLDRAFPPEFPNPPRIAPCDEDALKAHIEKALQMWFSDRHDIQFHWFSDQPEVEPPRLRMAPTRDVRLWLSWLASLLIAVVLTSQVVSGLLVGHINDRGLGENIALTQQPSAFYGHIAVGAVWAVLFWIGAVVLARWVLGFTFKPVHQVHSK